MAKYYILYTIGPHFINNQGVFTGLCHRNKKYIIVLPEKGFKVTRGVKCILSISQGCSKKISIKNLTISCKYSSCEKSYCQVQSRQYVPCLMFCGENFSNGFPTYICFNIILNFSLNSNI